MFVGFSEPFGHDRHHLQRKRRVLLDQVGEVLVVDARHAGRGASRRAGAARRGVDQGEPADDAARADILDDRSTASAPETMSTVTPNVHLPDRRNRDDSCGSVPNGARQCTLCEQPGDTREAVIGILRAYGHVDASLRSDRAARCRAGRTRWATSTEVDDHSPDLRRHAVCAHPAVGLADGLHSSTGIGLTANGIRHVLAGK